MYKKITKFLSKAGAILTLLAFVTSNVAAQALPLGGSGRQSADTIIRRLDAGGKDRVAWLARAREGLLEASADWERTLLAAGGTPGAMTAGLSAELDKAYAERLVSGFFEEKAGTKAADTPAQAQTKSASANFPELAFIAENTLVASLSGYSGFRTSAKAYEGKALAVAELASEVAGGSYSEYSLVANSKDTLPDSLAFVSATAVRERSLALAGEARAILSVPEAKQVSGQGIAAQETVVGLRTWERVEALISTDSANSLSETSAVPTPHSDKTRDSSSNEPTLRQSWLSYGSTQDALQQGLMQRFQSDKAAWLSTAENQLARPDTQAQFLGKDADVAARTYLTVVVPSKDLGQVTAEHREAESSSGTQKTSRSSPSSDDHPAHTDTESQVQKPNLLQKALQFIEAIVQSKPMEKVESSNRGLSSKAPIIDDHGIELMRQEQGTGGVSGTSDNTAGSSSSGKSTGGSSTKKNTQQAAIEEVNNTKTETADTKTSPIDEIKELENEKASIKDNQRTTQQAATKEVKQEPTKPVSNRGAEKAEEQDSKTISTKAAPEAAPPNSNRKGAEKEEAQSEGTIAKTPTVAPPNSSMKGAEKAENLDATSINTKAAPEAAPPNSSMKGAEKAEALDAKKSTTKTNSVADKFLAPLQQSEPIMLTDNSKTNNLASLEGIVGFKIDNSSSRKSITPQDYKYSNQRSDIDAPTDLYCVYTTEWNSYKNTYLVATGVELTKEQAILARENALKDEAINELGKVKSYADLAKSFNTTFGTNFGYKYTEDYVQQIPTNMSPTIQSDTAKKTTTLEFPHVRYKNSKYAHTTNYLGNNQVFDVWDGKEKDISGKGKVDKSAEGWDERYGENGSYRVGYHIWYIYD